MAGAAAAAAAGTRRASQQAANVRRAAWLASEGRMADGLGALMSEGLARHSPETKQAMRALFPQDAPPWEKPGAAPEPYQFHDEDVLRAVKSFKAGSAGGCLGMLPQHLKELVSGTSLPHAQRETLLQ